MLSSDGLPEFFLAYSRLTESEPLHIMDSSGSPVSAKWLAMSGCLPTPTSRGGFLLYFMSDDGIPLETLTFETLEQALDGATRLARVPSESWTQTHLEVASDWDRLDVSELERAAAQRDQSQSEYEFPPADKLVRYLALLFRVLIRARSEAHQTVPATARLLDAVHNIPDLLARWPDMHEDWIIEDLERYEEAALNGNPAYSQILKDGPPPNWQLRRSKKSET